MLSSLTKLLLLTILILLFTACASKSNGKYHTKYSYHPYYSLYANKMSGTPPKKKKNISKGTKTKSKISLNEKGRFPQ